MTPFICKTDRAQEKTPIFTDGGPRQNRTEYLSVGIACVLLLEKRQFVYHNIPEDELP